MTGLALRSYRTLRAALASWSSVSGLTYATVITASSLSTCIALVTLRALIAFGTLFSLRTARAFATWMAFRTWRARWTTWTGYAIASIAPVNTVNAASACLPVGTCRAFRAWFTLRPNIPALALIALWALLALRPWITRNPVSTGWASNRLRRVADLFEAQEQRCKLFSRLLVWIVDRARERITQFNDRRGCSAQALEHCASIVHDELSDS